MENAPRRAKRAERCQPALRRPGGTAVASARAPGGQRKEAGGRLTLPEEVVNSLLAQTHH